MLILRTTGQNPTGYRRIIMDQGSNPTRPAVLENVSETQMEELERQFNEQDQAGWERLKESYGWSDEDAEAVWDWFSIRPGGQR
jgi:hypothetical protein